MSSPLYYYRIPLLGCLMSLLLFSISPLAHADFRALLIGIDYHNRQAPDLIKPLCGGRNDIDDLYHLMTTTLGIPAKNIRVLRENQATREAILDAFQQWFIEGSKAGDQLFFHYSGHGMLIPDEQHTQAQDPTKQGNKYFQQFAEAFVPYDTTIDVAKERVDRIIRDSDLQPLLQQLEDRELTLFIDSCHSGGLTKSAGKRMTSTRRIELPWLKQSQAQVIPLFSTRGSQREDKPNTVTWQPAYRLFAAARYDQEASEYPLQACHDSNSQHFNGAATYALLSLLRKNPQANYSNQQVFQHSVSYLKNTIGIGDALQQPQFFAPQQAFEQPFVLLQQHQQAIASAVVKPPVASAHIELWLDQQGKQRFRQGAKPTLYYRVSALPTGQQRAWLTLLAIAEDGSVTLLNPSNNKDSNTQSALVNSEIIQGQRYQLPRNKTVATNENVMFDTQLIFAQTGKEHFKVLLSSTPITWDSKQWGGIKNHFAAQAGRDFLTQYRRLAEQQGVLLEQDLQIQVE